MLGVTYGAKKLNPLEPPRVPGITLLASPWVPGTTSGATRRCRGTRRLGSPRVPGNSLESPWGPGPISGVTTGARKFTGVTAKCQVPSGVTQGARNITGVTLGAGKPRPGVCRVPGKSLESPCPPDVPPDRCFQRCQDHVTGVIAEIRFVRGYPCADISADRARRRAGRVSRALHAVLPSARRWASGRDLVPSRQERGRQKGKRARKQAGTRYTHSVPQDASEDAQKSAAATWACPHLQVCICLLRWTCCLSAGPCGGCPASVPATCHLTASLPA